MMHGWEYGPWMGHSMWWMGVVWLVTVLIVAALIVFVVRQFTSRRSMSSALDVLGQAYARGELKRDEFLQKRADLVGH